MNKRATVLKDILKSLDPDVIEKSKSIESVVKDFYHKTYEEPLTFQVGDYEVIVQASGNKKKPDLRISCSCNYWKYQGPEYHAVQNDYLYGKTRGTADKPTKKDPEGKHKVCKHAYAVLREYFGAD